MTTSVYDQAKKLVQENISANVSSIVTNLAIAYGFIEPSVRIKSLVNLAEQAYELATSVDDYESTALDNGWTEQEDGTWHNDEDGTDAKSASEACEIDDLEPYELDVLEHWVVSEWLANKLRKHGEKVQNLGNLEVWARTTTGQSIYTDGVIQLIASETLR